MHCSKSGAKRKGSTKKRYFEKQESSTKVKRAKKYKPDTPQPTHDSDSASSSDMASDSGSDIDSNMDTDFETTHSTTPPHQPSRPDQFSATSRHGRATSKPKPKPTRPPTTETVYRSAVGNTSMKCSFDVAKRFGCRRCFFQFANETCVSHDTDVLQDSMVPASSWSQVQDAESDAIAAEEEARLATVQEVKAAMSDAGIEDNSTFWDEIEEDDLRNVDFDNDIDDGNQEDVHSEYTSTGPHTLTPQNSVVISDDEDLKSTTWNSGRDPSTPAPDPPSPTLPPVSPSRPILPLIAGFDFSFRFVYND
ncbi:hypothetical protein MVEG_04033 [Podila verticillata NRRL 6337]|nr:hypothetical protein MVEG_04033 [Podila verticillata NRRL 6337]